MAKHCIGNFNFFLSTKNECIWYFSHFTQLFIGIGGRQQSVEHSHRNGGKKGFSIFPLFILCPFVWEELFSDRIAIHSFAPTIFFPSNLFNPNSLPFGKNKSFECGDGGDKWKL